MASLRNFAYSVNLVIRRNLHLSRPVCGPDAREKRQGHIPKSTALEGEKGTFESSMSSYELIDENLMDKVIGNSKFKDIPILHIICTRNNTKLCITKANGIVEVTKSTGTEGFKNCRKGTTVAAQAVANRIVTYAIDHELDTFRLVFTGLGPGRGAAYKVLELSGLKIVSLSDRTEAIEPWILRPRGAKSL